MTRDPHPPTRRTCWSAKFTNGPATKNATHANTKSSLAVSVMTLSGMIFRDGKGGGQSAGYRTNLCGDCTGMTLHQNNV